MFFKRKPAVVRIDARVEWHYAQDPASGQWLGICPALNLNALGETFGELQEGASEAMQLLFADLYEEDDLVQFLREHGWRLMGELPPGGHTPQFDVPFDLERKSVNEVVPVGA